MSGSSLKETQRSIVAESQKDCLEGSTELIDTVHCVIPILLIRYIKVYIRVRDSYKPHTQL